MFTVEIAGRPTAIINASQEEAEEWFESEPFKDDLMVLETDGRPLWDGSAPRYLRRAFPEEVAVFERAFAKAVGDGSANPQDEDGYLVFLVPAWIPSDEDEDEG
jgi:hypothetical protein